MLPFTIRKKNKTNINKKNKHFMAVNRGLNAVIFMCKILIKWRSVYLTKWKKKKKTNKHWIPSFFVMKFPSSEASIKNWSSVLDIIYDDISEVRNTNKNYMLIWCFKRFWRSYILSFSAFCVFFLCVVQKTNNNNQKNGLFYFF